MSSEKEKQTIKPEDVGAASDVLGKTSPSQVGFTMKPITKKPTRKYRKGSKYDPILEAFKKGDATLVEVSLPEKDANYLRTQLNKRIEAESRKFKGITVSVVNNVCYLEKEKP